MSHPKRPIMVNFPEKDCNNWRVLFIRNGCKEYVSVMNVEDEDYYSVACTDTAVHNAMVLETDDVLLLIESQGDSPTFREEFRVVDPLGRQLNFLQFGQYIQIERKSL